MPVTVAAVGPAGADETTLDLRPGRRRGWGGRALLPVAALVLLVVVAAGLVLGPRGGQGHRAAAAPAAGTTAPAGRGAAPQSSGTAPAASPADPGPSPARRATASVTYEAEAASNTLSGSAFVTGYPGASGGRIVKNIGAWGNPAAPGSLRFDAVSAPAAGAYLLTFSYVHVSGDATRTVVITVSGSDPVTVTVTAGSACCSGQTLTVRLAAGMNTITFTNPKGHAPAMDRIEISPKPG
ncbi:MAG: hypothetical protein V7603_2216 [Micromonosporaceae bacterium]